MAGSWFFLAFGFRVVAVGGVVGSVGAGAGAADDTTPLRWAEPQST